MNFETKAHVLSSLTNKAATVLPSRDTMPVLKNFWVQASTNSLVVSATDLELTAVCSSSLLRCLQPGIAVLPGKRLLEILRSVDKEAEVSIQVEAGVATVSAGPTSWTLRLMPAEDYPEFTAPVEREWDIDREGLIRAIESVRHAASHDTVRPSLMLINVADQKMTAADGVRCQQVDMAAWWPEDLEFQLPIGAVPDLLALCKESQAESVQIGQSEDLVRFGIGADVFVAHKLSYRFPDVEKQLIAPSRANAAELSIDRAELRRAVQRVRINADATTNAIMLRLTRDRCKVLARDAVGNAAEEELLCQWRELDRDVVVNHRYLTELLSMSREGASLLKFGKDSKRSKGSVLLVDDHQLGIIQQMRAEWLAD